MDALGKRLAECQNCGDEKPQGDIEPYNIETEQVIWESIGEKDEFKSPAEIQEQVQKVDDVIDNIEGWCSECRE